MKAKGQKTRAPSALRSKPAEERTQSGDTQASTETVGSPTGGHADLTTCSISAERRLRTRAGGAKGGQRTSRPRFRVEPPRLSLPDRACPYCRRTSAHSRSIRHPRGEGSPSARSSCIQGGARGEQGEPKVGARADRWGAEGRMEDTSWTRKWRHCHTRRLTNGHSRAYNAAGKRPRTSFRGTRESRESARPSPRFAGSCARRSSTEVDSCTWKAARTRRGIRRRHGEPSPRSRGRAETAVCAQLANPPDEPATTDGQCRAGRISADDRSRANAPYPDTAREQASRALLSDPARLGADSLATHFSSHRNAPRSICECGWR